MNESSTPFYLKSMATISRSNLTNLLEKVIDPTLRKLFTPTSKSPVVRMWMEGRNGGEGTTPGANGQRYISIKHGRHSNMQTQGEGATLMRGRGRDAQANFVTKTLPGAFTFSLKAKKSSEKRAGSLVDTVMNEVDGMMEKAKSMQAFYANNDGKGVFAMVNDATPNSQTTMPIDGIRATSIEHLIDPGDSFGVGIEADRVSGAGENFTVSSFTGSTIVTTETSAAIADDDLLYFSEAYDVTNATETSKIGLDGLLVSSGTVQGVATASNLWYQAHIDTTAEVVGAPRILEYLQKSDARTKNAANKIVTMGDVWWKMNTLLAGTPQADPNKMQTVLQGGAEGLFITYFGGGTPIIYDPYCRPGYVAGLDLSNLGYCEEWPLSLVDDGANLAHRISQTLEYEVAASEDGNFYVIDPRSCFKLSGKTTA